MKKFPQLLFFILFSVSIQAQQNFADSLQHILNTHPATEQAITVQQQLADWYRAAERYPEAIQMAELSLRNSKKISADNLGTVKAYWILSNIYTNTEKFDQAKEYIDKASISAKKQDNPLALAYANYAAAMLRSTLFDNEATLKYLNLALTNIPDPEKEPLLTARIYYFLYGIYTEWNDEHKSMEYIHKALTYAQKSSNKNMLANVYSAISVVYTFRYEKTKQKKYLDSIMQPLDKAIELFHRYPGQVMNNTYSHCLNNKASYYLKYYNADDPVIKQKMRDNIKEALRATPSGNDVVISNSYGMLSELSMRENNLPAAEKYLTIAYDQIAQRKKPYYHTLINVLTSLVKLSTKKGDYEKALTYQQKITEYNSLLFDEQSAAVTKRLEAQFELSKKEREIESLQEKASGQKKQKYLLIALITIGGLGAVFMFRSYHFNLRYSLAREKQLTAEKNEAAIQIKYEKEEQARLKAEQELLALQQQKLQNEVMANQLHLQHKNDVLQQLKEKLSNQEPVNIQQIIREETLNDNDFEKAKFHIQEMHPDFFGNLNKHAKQKLTTLDLKYCAYLYLGMDTKTIAGLLNVEPKSVRMTKYRLKQKFDLDAEKDLVNYIKEIG
ncbi:tetratricopeptide repeat protein [Chryseobacterium shigense]|uniref:DNA-binding CsgD family transcriptional regulator n=1 Tax=Chryseobacterium shigense TaxID=297244 RepID=A0A841MXK1_9FLAO|nr:tetratricopeptide repeat protein [Chryseobacterium shigense]MBB6369666.1 DNA-binding CsgD family transcriptional regulator [Chryseobacterium shigense]